MLMFIMNRDFCSNISNLLNFKEKPFSYCSKTKLWSKMYIMGQTRWCKIRFLIRAHQVGPGGIIWGRINLHVLWSHMSPPGEPGGIIWCQINFSCHVVSYEPTRWAWWYHMRPDKFTCPKLLLYLEYINYKSIINFKLYSIYVGYF